MERKRFRIISVFWGDYMKKLILKMKTILKMSTIIMVAMVLFLDEDILNSMILQYNEEFVVEEVASSVVDNKSNDQLEGQVVVNDKAIESTYATLLNKAQSDYWVWPTDSNYVITSYFGYRWGSMHDALDISGPGYGSNIYAANNGVVISVKGGCVAGNTSCNGRGGNYIIINHNSNNYYTIYMHLKDIKVKEGQVVSRGEVIGTMGNTGNVVPVPTYSNPYAGTHLHFALYIGEPYKGGYAVNPMRLY